MARGQPVTFRQLLFRSLSYSPLPILMKQVIAEKNYEQQYYRDRAINKCFEIAMFLGILSYGLYNSYVLHNAYNSASDAAAVTSRDQCLSSLDNIHHPVINTSGYASLAVGVGLIALEQLMYWTAINNHRKIMNDVLNPTVLCSYPKQIVYYKSLNNLVHWIAFWTIQFSGGLILNEAIKGWWGESRDLFATYLYMAIPGVIFFVGGKVMEWNASRLFSQLPNYSVHQRLLPDEAESDPNGDYKALGEAPDNLCSNIS